MKFHDFFRERMLSLCEERNITINKLSVLSGITQSTVDNIMRGKSNCPRIDTLRKLAHGLNMDWLKFIEYIYPPDAEFDDID